METHLALGAHDLAQVEGNISLRILDGSELFVPLGTNEPARVQNGEYGYCDDGNEVLCRLEVRQVEKTKVTSETKDCFFIIQGHKWVDDGFIKSARDRLGDALMRFCGGRFEGV